MNKLALTKPVCQLDKYKCFVGMTNADLDPLELGHYLLPGGSIDVEPPFDKKGYVAKWENDKWIYIEDHRNEIVYSIETGAAVIIEVPGELPKTVTTEPRPDQYHVFINDHWTMTAETEQQKLSDQEREKRNKINQLLSHAAQKISEYQDLIDFAETDNEAEEWEGSYKAWRQYRAALLKYQKKLITELPACPAD